MKNTLKEIVTGFNSLLTGMRITIGQFFKPIVTVQYPHESLKMAKRFRGHIELVTDPATGIAKCFVCKLCEKACPSDCITVEGIKPEGARRKTVTSYRLDFTKCSLCGSCVEACRDGAIRYSHEYNLASTSREDYVMDLFKRLENEAKRQPESPAQTLVPSTGTPAPASPEPKLQAPSSVAPAATTGDSCPSPAAPISGSSTLNPQPSTLQEVAK
jgi:NADH-quinone oxidoreductase subunit I